MKIKDLYDIIDQLLRKQDKYILNNPNRIDTHILEFNRKNKVWDFYFLDERGGENNLRTFTTEEEACEYVFNDIIEFIKTSENELIEAVRFKYLGTHNLNYQFIKLHDLFYAIEQLGQNKDIYLKDQSIKELFSTRCMFENKKWLYSYFHEINGVGISKTFTTEKEVSEYIFNVAIESIKTFRDAYLNSIKQSDV
ncbi:MAG: hypothetical protein LBR65_02015 [Culturomica sp.]|jgi:hypothetical protein|nr:hypothetical protein [Culturomica sp.]